MQTKLCVSLAILFACSCGAPEDGDPTETGQTTNTIAKGETTEPDAGNETTSDAETDDGTDVPVDMSADDAEATGEGLAAMFDTVFVANGCTAGYCHGAMGLSTADDAYAAFVNVEAPSPICGRTHYVVPGEPEESILWLKIRETTDEDIECEITKMPKDRQQPLPTEVTDLVYEWILNGAAP